MAFAKIRLRRGPKTEWEEINPVLMEGEWGVEYPDAGLGTGLCKVKIGNGSSKWTDLTYALNPFGADSINGGTVDDSHTI